MTIVENCVACLTVLIVRGWKSKISSRLVQQIFSMLVFIVDGIPGSENKRERPEEVILEGFRALTALLSTAISSIQAASGLAEPEWVPALGHGVTVMLNGAVDGANAMIQDEALKSVRVLYKAIRDHSALASFLPGTVSSLANLLATPARYKTSVLSSCIGTLQMVLTRVLSDMRTRSIMETKDADKKAEADVEKEAGGKLLSPAWLKATVAQVKMALTTVVKLRTNDSDQVQHSLERLCIALLDECHESLKNCTTFLVETAIILDSESTRESAFDTTITDLVRIHTELGDTVKTIAYTWMSSLPRMMQSGDEDVKRHAVHNMSKGIELLRRLDIESATLEEALSNTLRDTITSLLNATKGTQTNQLIPVQLLETKAMVKEGGGMVYSPVLFPHESQRSLKREVLGLIRTVGGATQETGFLASTMDFIHDTTGNGQVAAFWLCFETIKAAHKSAAEQDAFLDLAAVDSSSLDVEPVFNELYSFSVELLDSHSEGSDVDWRLEAIALEVTAYVAQRSGKSFRPELIDVLFPIATFLGSDNANLQQHAIATLNTVATASEYVSVSDLIVSNVDYMVNSVALRLNTLDISPASTQVLTMMVRLAGPRLIPYLDDVVDSIFAALDNYHGYPMFVQSLFEVLKEIVDQASQSGGKLLAENEKKSINHRKQPHKQNGLDSLTEYFAKKKERKARDDEEANHLRPLEGHPAAPWAEEDNKDADVEGGPPPSEEKAPNSLTYKLLNRVASQTQYYLTSPTPRLRRSLLELLQSAATVLAADEDSFLPLVNAIWPVVITRLKDPEPFIVVEACQTLAGLCESAGDFLTTRFKTEWRDGLGEFCANAKQAATSMPVRSTAPKEKRVTRGNPNSLEIALPTWSESGSLEAKKITVDRQQKSHGSLGQHASPARIWEAVIGLLTAIVSFVQIDEDMFDEILDLVADVLDKKQDTKEALEAINADAVWLVQYRRGQVGDTIHLSSTVLNLLPCRLYGCTNNL